MIAIKGVNCTPEFIRANERDPNRLANIKSGKPSRSHFSWKDIEVKHLIGSYNSGEKIPEIAVELERAPLAISAKLNKLSLITEEEHQKNRKNKDLQGLNAELFEALIEHFYNSKTIDSLSCFYPFNGTLIDRFSKIWNFKELSNNENIEWDSALIERYQHRWDWMCVDFNKGLSGNRSLPWSERLIEK